ncbi:hypothetical protein G1C95_0966 [Bifidobacterium sp. DSM 109957]|uniref:Peptide ABC transporter permease n=2 Tax=Bifidobacterium oedipodis TaxID=2675322 RepID=A0A7Y0HS97_9BIFI|nr:hypothetical protein [Bifidobacterium sp. DSM 109957]NMM93781.1 hypothetical protein [Bifidobacterium sp. DSM 109957]
MTGVTHTLKTVMAQQFRGSRPVKGGKNSKSRSKRGKRKLSKRQRAIYRRRRIVVGVALVVSLALVVFCVYSLSRGFAAIGTVIRHDEVYAISRDSVPEPNSVKKSGITDCSAKDLTLQLTAASQSVGVGGTMQFTAGMVYEGSGSCLVDGSDSNRVLTITSGNETIYRSDVCEVDARMLLMAKGDKDSQKIDWNTNANATLTECTDEDTWAKVNPGTYVAQLSLKDNPKVKSEQVVFTVQ